MVYRALGDKLIYANAIDNLLKAQRGTGIIDYDGFKVTNSLRGGLKVAVPLGGAAQIQGVSQYWTDLNFNMDKSKDYNDNDTNVNQYDNAINYDSYTRGVRQRFNAAGWVEDITFRIGTVGTVAFDLTVELYNETDSAVVDTIDIDSADADGEYTWTLTTGVFLDFNKVYSLRFYRADNASVSDNSNNSTSNYYVLYRNDANILSDFFISAVERYDGSASDFVLAGSAPIFMKFTAKDYSWSSQARSTISIDTTVFSSSPNSLKWVYDDDGLTQYNNNIYRYFASNKQDWTKRDTIKISFRAEQSLDDDIQVYITNNGTTYLIGTISNSDIDVGNFVDIYFSAPIYRDKVENIYFRIDGNNWATGTYTFYIDNISVYKELEFTAPTNPDEIRIDVVYLDIDNNILIKTGTPVDETSDTPIPEDLDIDEIGLAHITIRYGDTSFDVEDILDIRVPLNEGD